MLSYFLDKHIIGITKFLEGTLTLLHLVVLSSTIYFLSMTIRGEPFREDIFSRFEMEYTIVLWIVIFEVLLTLTQRFLLRIADPYPLNRLEKVISPKSGNLRIFFRGILLPIILLIIVGMVDDYCKKTWLVSHEDLPVIRFVCSMNLAIPLLSAVAKQIHWKFWSMVGH